MNLQALYRRFPTDQTCDGCHECVIKCAAPVSCAEEEWERIREWIVSDADAQTIRRAIGSPKEIRVDGFHVADYCVFLDSNSKRCAIYPVRPLICRLLGFVEWMPCPTGKVADVLANGYRIMVEYAELGLRPIEEWIARAAPDWIGEGPVAAPAHNERIEERQINANRRSYPQYQRPR